MTQTTTSDILTVQKQIMARKMAELETQLEREIQAELIESEAYQTSRQQSLSTALAPHLEALAAIQTDTQTWRERIEAITAELTSLVGEQSSLSARLTRVQNDVASVAGAHHDAYGADGSGALVNAITAHLDALRDDAFLRTSVDTRMASAIGLATGYSGTHAASRLTQAITNAVTQAAHKSAQATKQN